MNCIIHGRIILNWILNKLDGINLSVPKQRQAVDCCEHSYKISASINIRMLLIGGLFES